MVGGLRFEVLGSADESIDSILPQPNGFGLVDISNGIPCQTK